jgi:cytochrome c peroxidase
MRPPLLRPSALLLIIGLIGVMVACRKDPTEPEVPGNGPTPASVNVPQWVLDSIGPMMPAPNNPLTVEGIALGRKLFHDPLLSDNYTQSCSSCHAQQHGFSDSLSFSVGTNGATGSRNAMAVINLGWDDHFFWDGRRHSLEEQAHDPVTNPIEMRNTWPVVVQRLQDDPDYVIMFAKAFGATPIDSTQVVKAIAQFERTLVSFNSPFDRFQYLGDSTALNQQEQRGLTVFMRDGHCVDCHSEPLLVDHGLRNNGLDMNPVDSGYGGITGNPNDVGKFKVPTLRNIAHTAPYMHDSRFTTLEQVVNFYAHDVQVNNPHLDPHMDPWRFGLVNLDAQDEADLVAFLRALSDEDFLNNPAFGPPQ